MSSDEDVKELADLRQWLEDKIRTTEDELLFLKKMIAMVDKQLSDRSFVKAAKVPFSEVVPVAEEVITSGKQVEKRPLRRAKDGYLLGEAEVTEDEVVIKIAEDVVLSSSTPPFKSYFLGKVLGGMRSDDERMVEQGKLSGDKVLSYDLEEEAGRIKKIVVRSYRDKKRLEEILSTATWTFTRMLEKQA